MRKDHWQSSPVSFQDLGTLAVTGELGRDMPKLKPNILDSVFYLYRINPKTGKRTGPHGSGFIFGRRSKVLPRMKHYYAISNWHLTNDLGASIVRLNTADGKSRYIDFAPEDWHFAPRGDDLSAVDISDHEQLADQVTHFAEEGSVTQELMARFEIGVGEDAFMMGLFADQHGGERNTPAARFGNVSLLASDNALIEQPNGIMRPSHLVDMRSRTGFSGSPVSVYRIPTDDLSTLNDKPGPLPLPGEFRPGNAKFIALFGVHCGQFYDAVEARKSPPKRTERESNPIQEGDKLYIQSGMTIVVPAWRISELLDQEVFEMARKKREEQSQEWQRKIMGEADADPPATDENPNAREDFTSLLGAAARKQRQGD